MTIELGVLIAVGGLFISLSTFLLNKNRTIKQESHQDAKIQAQLDYIGKGVDDIRIDQKTSDRQIQAVMQQVIRVEESSKQAHKRIDNLEGK